MKVTAATITDEQIRQLLVHGECPVHDDGDGRHLSRGDDDEPECDCQDSADVAASAQRALAGPRWSARGSLDRCAAAWNARHGDPDGR